MSEGGLLQSASFLQQQSATILKTLRVIVLLILWLMNLHESTSWQKSSQTGLQTDNLMSRNNPLRNTDSCNSVSRMFDYNQIPKYI